MDTRAVRAVSMARAPLQHYRPPAARSPAAAPAPPAPAGEDSLLSLQFTEGSGAHMPVLTASRLSLQFTEGSGAHMPVLTAPPACAASQDSAPHPAQRMGAPWHVGEAIPSTSSPRPPRHLKVPARNVVRDATASDSR